MLNKEEEHRLETAFILVNGAVSHGYSKPILDNEIAWWMIKRLREINDELKNITYCLEQRDWEFNGK